MSLVMVAIPATVALLVAAVVVAALLLEKRPGYGAYYGLAKLSGARLDIGPVDWATLRRRRSGNDALVCAAGYCPDAPPDREAATYAVPPAELLARLRSIALAEPRTRELVASGPQTARFIQYTRLMRFPDTIDARALPAPDGRSTLAIYSRSLLGSDDFGVNAARIRRWLGKLDAAAART